MIHTNEMTPFIIDTFASDDVQLHIAVNRVIYNNKLGDSPYRQVYLYPAKNNKDSEFIASVINAIPKTTLNNYLPNYSLGYNDSGIYCKDSLATFWILDDFVEVQKSTADTVMQKYFTNYYWYMESLIKQGKVDISKLISPIPAEEGKNWYEDFVEALHKYYPTEAKEIDERIKSGDLVDVNSLDTNE